LNTTIMKHTIWLFILVLLIAVVYISCSKGDSAGGNNPPPDPCSGVTVAVSASVTNASGGQNNGAIVAGATGGNGFTFSLNNGAFQSSGTFSSLAAGTYTITAKNSNGCTGSQSFTVVANNSCTGVNIVVTGTSTAVTPCGGPGGSITASASGSTGFTFSIDNGAFQASNSFTNLAAGNHTIVAKDANGCSQSAIITVGTAAAGSLFSAVRSVIQTFWVSCHNNSVENGGMNWEVDCNIIAHKDRIKIRAVDQAGTANQMPAPPNPALSTADRQKILDWINAGGTFTN
jgi:cytochrome c551/c552